MNKTEARQLVVDAFDKDNFYFYSTTPKQYTGFIDGMAWTSILCGAARLVGDLEVAGLCEEYIGRILTVGKDARTYAPTQVDSSWLVSETMPGFWYKKKPQSFAGPAGLQFAIDCGSPVENPFNVMWKARLFTWLASLYGSALQWPVVGQWLRQHLNSMWLAHLITKRKPPTSLLWTAKNNLFYAYIAGQELTTEAPKHRRYTQGESVEVNHVVPISERKPSTWVWRQWPKSEYRWTGQGEPQYEDLAYTPAAYLAGLYLQEHLKGQNNA